MSDYLTRLSARALGIAETVRPVIAPLFTPAPLPILAPVEGRNEQTDSNATNRLERAKEIIAEPPHTLDFAPTFANRDLVNSL